MRLDLFRTLWGYDRPWNEAIVELRAAGFDGIEARVPATRADAQALGRLLRTEGVPYIATLLTGPGVLPDQAAGVDAHLDDLRRKLDLACLLAPRFVNILGGNDRWGVARQVDFIGRAQDLCRAAGVTGCFETHRARILAGPWLTLEVIRQHPDVLLTTDISHWVVVSERLLDDPMDDLSTFVARVHHVQARVGYDQGPQVPHPADPAHARDLAFHQAHWRDVWRSQAARGYQVTTLTPEFGPDGYLHRQPFTGTPVADLWGLNVWMGQAQRAQFARFLAGDR
ncbi:sugar phosphate isomerase/epimerase [Gluconacetobacter azotocaptans]|uniref:Sugar phosphate isomerase/epimerase n=1 Tax=Gluconacetobacter azotocaptans TaxID=142834 RepID=A0A7W4PE85_9PROT|nr:sugar phosphate isomerase/epimerase [Gluconacetobacter azotocaptans]MBB2191052.1 sugar phosphate isomerase/epimerase [Gluconacetobacter azotocaptans]MBM9401973.1 sugar phosphate isomerase/epimerase [Gluconacetobacter azotocaptans]GBQ36395.1 xylose isomerase [Gluconacetobacter azotocaptans DSM 13594]